MTPRPPRSTLFPYTTLFRSGSSRESVRETLAEIVALPKSQRPGLHFTEGLGNEGIPCTQGLCREPGQRSEEHTSELQSPVHLVCRLLLEKKKSQTQITSTHA